MSLASPPSDRIARSTLVALMASCSAIYAGSLDDGVGMATRCLLHERSTVGFLLAGALLYPIHLVIAPVGVIVLTLLAVDLKKSADLARETLAPFLLGPAMIGTFVGFFAGVAFIVLVVSKRSFATCFNVLAIAAIGVILRDAYVRFNLGKPGLFFSGRSRREVAATSMRTNAVSPFVIVIAAAMLGIAGYVNVFTINPRVDSSSVCRGAVESARTT